MNIETRFKYSQKRSTMHVVFAYSATASTASKSISSQDLNKVSHIHWHFLHCSIVESLNVTKNPLVFFSNKVYGHTFPPKSTPSANSTRSLFKQCPVRLWFHVLNYVNAVSECHLVINCCYRLLYFLKSLFLYHIKKYNSILFRDKATITSLGLFRNCQKHQEAPSSTKKKRFFTQKPLI